MNILLASGNPHKLLEFSQLVHDAELEINVWSAEAIGGMPTVEESGSSFHENAAIKAQALKAVAPADYWILADDSGLAVDSLNGEPGIYSARYAGRTASDQDNLLKLLEQLTDVPDEQRAAAFHCSLVLIAQDGTLHTFDGQCPGTIIKEPRGTEGFGYDPVFVPQGYRETFAELGEVTKNKISHRANAAQELLNFLRSIPPE